MPDLVGSATPWRKRRLQQAGVLAGLVASLLLAAAAVALWVGYGGAVFFEIITGGLAACF
jgi:hypothetical protein